MVTCESAIGELTYQLQRFGRILNGVPASNNNCESALGGATYLLQQFGRIRIRHLDNFDITGAPRDVPGKSALESTTYQNYWNHLDQINITGASGDVSDVD